MLQSEKHIFIPIKAMITDPISEAEKANPLLAPLAVLIGEWETVGRHPFMPDQTLRGNASFKWLKGGAFMIMHSSIEQEDFPAGIAIFGSDSSSDEYTMLYYDEREVSRRYTSTLKNNIWKWWRDDLEFSQRFTCTIIDEGNTIVSKGEMSRNGGPWEKDLELTYTRITQ